MKQSNLMVLFLLMVGMGMTFAACSSDDEDEKGTLVEQVKCDEATVAFFDGLLPQTANDHLASGFFQIPEWTDRDACLVINSVEELRNVYDEEHAPSLQGLNIDFSTSTLIVGQKNSADELTLPGRRVRQVLREDSGNYVLHLYYEGVSKDDFVSLQRPKLVYYWAVYPKLKQKNVYVELNLI